MPRDPLLHPGRPEIDITGNGAPSPPPSIYTFKLTRWDEKAGLHGIRYAPNNRRAQGTRERRPAVKKISTVATRRNMIFNEPRLTISVDLGDPTSHYCILDEAGKVILENGLPTTPKGIQQVFGWM